MGFLAAVRFLTIIPIPGHKLSPREVGRSIVYFPLVGGIIGLILIFLNWLLGFILPPALAYLLLVISLVIVTGGLHLDGLADTCDGMVGQKTAEERWQVMKDSRTGAFGIIGVCCLLLLKYIALISVPSTWLMPTLVLMPVVSRWTMVCAIFTYPYAKPSGVGKIFKDEAGSTAFLAATVIALAIALMPARLVGLMVMFGTGIIVMAIAFYLKNRFGGLTGDNYGAINELAEVMVLILVCFLAHVGWLS